MKVGVNFLMRGTQAVAEDKMRRCAAEVMPAPQQDEVRVNSAAPLHAAAD